MSKASKTAGLSPTNKRHLIGSKWSAQIDCALEFRHWHVVALSKDGIATLAASLNSAERMSLPWRKLRDRTLWTPGWC